MFTWSRNNNLNTNCTGEARAVIAKVYSAVYRAYVYLMYTYIYPLSIYVTYIDQKKNLYIYIVNKLRDALFRKITERFLVSHT